MNIIKTCELFFISTCVNKLTIQFNIVNKYVEKLKLLFFNNYFFLYLCLKNYTKFVTSKKWWILNIWGGGGGWGIGRGSMDHSDKNKYLHIKSPQILLVFVFMPFPHYKYIWIYVWKCLENRIYSDICLFIPENPN